MNKIYFNFLILSAILISFSAKSQNLLGIYQFAGAGLCPNQNPAVTAQPQFGAFSDFQSLGVNCSQTGEVYNNFSWNPTATLDLNEYIGFSVNATDCYRLNLDSLVFSYKNSPAGGTPSWYIRSSVDNYATDIDFGTSNSTAMSTSLINLGSSSFDNLMQISFRIYVTGMAGPTSTTFRVDDVKLFGTIDFVGPINFYTDNDLDGFGAGSPTLLCSDPGGYSQFDTDCNDADSLINPNTIWYQDNDSDGFGDENISFAGCLPVGLTNPVLVGGDCSDIASDLNPNTVWYEDADNDMFGNDNNMLIGCTHPFALAVHVGGDCMDDQASVYPGALEICDLFDNNCDGDVNEDLTMTTYYIDADNDTYGSSSAGDFCDDPGIDYSINNTDCDDNDNAVYQTDTLFIDLDADGFDNGTAIMCIGSNLPIGYMATTLGADCNDTVATINPAGVDILGDSIDQNCDGIVDGYVGIEKIKENEFSIFPNPGSEFVTIKFNTKMSGLIVIQSIEGKTVFSKTVESNSMTVDASELNSGIYFIEITSSQEKLKWIKK